jgi:hypothetical protein
MANIKPIESSGDKYSRRAGAAGADYATGVQNPRKSWSRATQDGEANYKAGVTAAAAAGRFGKGVVKAGDSKWQQNSIAKGPNRFAEGVSLAKGDWEKGFAPYQSAISALTLPARGPKGSAQNLTRVTAVANTLRGVFEKKT